MAEAWDEGRRVDAQELLELVTAVFRRCGMAQEDAHLLADSLVFADLSGIHSHGVLRVPEYAKKMTVDGVDPKGRPEIARAMGACLVVDGHNSMGQIGCHFAMREAIERAREHGVGVAAITARSVFAALARSGARRR